MFPTYDADPVPRRRVIRSGITAISLTGIGTASGQSTCAPGQAENRSLEQIGPASLAVPIVTAELIDGSVYVVTRGLQPALLGEFDLETRTVDSHYELPTGSGAWGSTSINGGADLYVGTYGVADLYRFQTGSIQLSRVARFDDESFVMDIDAHAGDQQVYAGTYPTANIYEYDQSTDEVRSLGTANPEEAYVRSVAVTADTVFAGVGSHADLVAIDRESGEKRHVLPPELESDSFVYDLEATADVVVAGTEPSGRLAVIDASDYSDYEIVEPADQRTVDAATIVDGTVYFTTRTAGAVYEYETATGDLTRLATPSPGDETRELFERDGRLVGAAGSGAVWSYDLDDGTVTVTDLQKAGLPAQAEPPQSMTLLDGKPVVGGHWRFTVHDPETGDRTQFRTYGEPKAMTSVDGVLYQAIYPGGIVAKYDPATGDVTRTATVDHQQNRPRDIHYDNQSETLFIGTRPQYGFLGGALVAYDPMADEIVGVHRDLVQDQSIAAVTTARDTAFVGTEIYGGIGAEPVADEAKLAAVDPETLEKQWEMAPVPDASVVRHLVTSPDTSDGRNRVYGVTNGGVFFAVDPNARSTVFRESIADSGGELGLRDRRVFGVDATSLYQFDTARMETKEVRGDLDPDWYNEPQLAINGCAVYLLAGRDLSRVTVHRQPDRE